MAWPRLRTLSFFKIFDTCAFTVASESDSSQAMILFGLPFTNWRNTVVSAGDSRRRSSFASGAKFCALEAVCESRERARRRARARRSAWPRRNRRRARRRARRVRSPEAGCSRGRARALRSRVRRAASSPRGGRRAGASAKRSIAIEVGLSTFATCCKGSQKSTLFTVISVQKPMGSAYSELFVRIIY